MKTFLLPALLATIFAPQLTAASPAIASPAPVLEQTVAADAELAGGWRAFATAGQAYRFARAMQCQGYFTNVFCDPCNNWWVCEYA